MERVRPPAPARAIERPRRVPRSSAASPRRDARSRLARSGAHCRYAGTGVGALIYCVAQVALLAAFGSIADAGGLVGALVAVGAVSVFLFGALTLLMGSASSDYVDPKLNATASGVMNASQYLSLIHI